MSLQKHYIKESLDVRTELTHIFIHASYTHTRIHTDIPTCREHAHFLYTNIPLISLGYVCVQDGMSLNQVIDTVKPTM